MLQQLLHIIIISCICIIWGLPLYSLFLHRRNEGFFTEGFGKIITLFFSGILTLSFLSSWMILFFPLKFIYLLAGTVVLLISFMILSKKNNELTAVKISKLPFIAFLFSVTCILLFILLGAAKPANPDTHIYHLQIIRWANEYGTVPGLANLYPRFGLGSNWFNLVSLFYIPVFPHQNFTFLNNTITIWFLLWLLSKWHKHYLLSTADRLHKSFTLFYFLLIVYCLFDWQLFRDASNSTSYDFIVTALTLMVICYLVENNFIYRDKNFSLFLCFLTLSIIPFKLSGIFILLILLVYLLQFRTIKLWLQAAIAGILIITPLLIKNHINTGYPLFPATFSISSPGWQLPVEMTKNMNAYIMKGNKFYNYPTSFMNAQDTTTFNWIPFWIKNVLPRHKVLLILSLLSFVIFFFNPIKQENLRRFRFLFGAAWLMLIGWFFTAPDPRFAFGILLFLASFPLCLLFAHLLNRRIYLLLMAIAILPVIGYGYMKTKTIDDAKVLLEPVNIENPVYKTETKNGIELHNTRVNNDWMCPCVFTTLPCFGENNPFVKPRSTDLSDGFYMDPKPDSSFIKNYNY
ncbi:MAG TPA: hypothetical protein VF476_18415 [Chitinophagaceae bacterium]